MITKFVDIFTNYESYSNKGYLMNRLSARMLGQVSNLFIKGLKNKVQNYNGTGTLDLDKSFQVMCNIVCEYTEMKKSTNWEWYFITEDYQKAFQRFLLKPFYSFMDAASHITLELLDGEIVKELNSIFLENSFGYRIQNDAYRPWISINSDVNLQKEKNNIVEEIEKIKENLAGMEELIIKVTNTDDFNDAVEKMQENRDIWGPELITEEGIRLRNLLDTVCPAKMTIEQAEYFVERILVYVKYISKFALS